MLCCNILRGHILPLCGVYPDLFKTRFIHIYRQCGILPYPLPPSPRMSPGDPSRDPVLESSQGLIHTRGSGPTSLTRKSTPPVQPPFKITPRSSDMPPSWPRILLLCVQLFLAFRRFPAISVQLSSPSVRTRPRYLN